MLTLLTKMMGGNSTPTPHTATARWVAGEQSHNGRSSAGQSLPSSTKDARQHGHYYILILWLLSNAILAYAVEPRYRIQPQLGWGSDQVVDVTSAGSVTGTDVAMTGLVSCDTIDTDANGNFRCGTDSGGGGNSFETIAVPAGTNPVADSATDTLTITETSPLTITGTAGTDTIDITWSSVDIGSDGTIQADAVALSTDTTGAYVATLVEGLAIDATGTGAEGATGTIAFDPTELTGSRTFGDASTDTIVWTWNRATGTDPTLTMGDATVTGQTVAAATAFELGVDRITDFTGAGIVLTSGALTTSGIITESVSSTDNAIVRWDSVDGKVVQNSNVLIDDSNNLIVPDNAILGLSTTTGRIEFDDQATDEVNILDGNVGIGTTAPGARLDVNGVTNLRDDLDIDGANVNITLQHTGGDEFGLHTEAGSILYLKNTTDRKGYLLVDATHRLYLGTQDGVTGDIVGLAVRTDGTGDTEVELPSGSIGTTEITDAAVTYAKMQNVSATDQVLGRSSAGAGSVEELTFTDAAQDHAQDTFADDQTWVADSATAGTPRTLPNCTDTGGNHLNYTQSTNTFSCGTSSGTPSDIAARVRNSANITLPDATFTLLTFDTEDFDTDTIHSTVSNTGRLTATTAGKYTIGCAVTIDGGTVMVGVVTRIRLNGATVLVDAGGNWTGTVAADAYPVAVTRYNLAANDYVECLGYIDTSDGTSKNASASANKSPVFWMNKEP